VRLRCGQLFAQASTDNGGEAFVVMDEQASHTHRMGMSLEELQAQRTELLPERLEMSRRRRRRRRNRGPIVVCPAVYPIPPECPPPVPVRF
jgi:hypothetical protein